MAGTVLRYAVWACPCCQNASHAANSFPVRKPTGTLRASHVQHAPEYTRSPRDDTRISDPNIAIMSAMTHFVQVCCGSLHTHHARPPALPEADTGPPLHRVHVRKLCHWETITVLWIPCTRERQRGFLTPGPSRRSAELSHVRKYANPPRAKQIDHCSAFLA
jgi:hypothetical protein